MTADIVEDQEVNSVETRLIPLAQIFGHDPLTTTSDFPGSTQIRVQTDKALTERYARLMVDGARFPPITVVEQAPDAYLLGDGHHRVEAAWTAHALDAKKFPAQILAEIYQGDFADAVRLGIEANRSHGKALTDDDLRNAYLRACGCDLVAPHDAQAVQKLLGCSRRSAFVLTEFARNKYKAERDALIIALTGTGRTQRDIAAVVGVTVSVVNSVLQDVRKVQAALSEQDKGSERTEAKLELEEPPAKDSAKSANNAAAQWQKRLSELRQEAAKRIKEAEENDAEPVPGVYPLPEPPPLPFKRPPPKDDALARIADALEDIDQLPDPMEAIEAEQQFEPDEETTAAIAERLDRSLAWLMTFKDAWKKGQ